MRLREIFVVVLFCSVTVFHVQAQTSLTPDKFDAITVDNIKKLASQASFAVEDATDIAWSPDENALLLGTDNGAFSLDITTGDARQIREGTIDKVRYVPNTSQVLLDDISQLVIHVEDLAYSPAYPVLDMPFSGTIAFSHDGLRIAVGGFNTVTVNDLRTYNELKSFDVRQFKPCEAYCTIVDEAFSPDDTSLVFAAEVPEVESAIVNLKTGTRVSPIEIGAWDLSFNHDGSLIASAAGEPGYIPNKVLLTDARTGKAAAEIKVYVSSLAFSNGGNLLAVGAWDDNAPNPDEATGFVYFFDVEQLLTTKGTAPPILTLPSDRPPSAVRFSPDDRLVAISDNAGQLSLWGVPSTTG